MPKPGLRPRASGQGPVGAGMGSRQVTAWAFLAVPVGQVIVQADCLYGFKAQRWGKRAGLAMILHARDARATGDRLARSTKRCGVGNGQKKGLPGKQACGKLES